MNQAHYFIGDYRNCRDFQDPKRPSPRSMIWDKRLNKPAVADRMITVYCTIVPSLNRRKFSGFLINLNNSLVPYQGWRVLFFIMMATEKAVNIRKSILRTDTDERG
jgi:hypothetical protein